MPAKKTASRRKKPAKTSRRKAAKSRPVSKQKAVGKKRKVIRKKAKAKKSPKKRKAVARKRPAAKKRARRKKAMRKKPAAKKSAKRKKATRKKPAAKKSARRKKVTRKKRTSRKKVARKKVARKKLSKKKKAVARKKATKKVTKKAPARRKVVSRKAPVRKAPVRKTPLRKVPLRAPRRSTADLLSGPIHGIEPYVPKRGDDYMDPQQLGHFEAILASWKGELMVEVDRTVHHMQDEAANFPDPNDRATQESEFGLELRTRDRERKLLRKINSALARIDEGTYGFCEETGEAIGLKRLEARPVATLCVEAQERREMAERQFRDQDDRYR